MKRRDFLKTTAAAAGASALPFEALAQSDRRKELLIGGWSKFLAAGGGPP